VIPRYLFQIRSQPFEFGRQRIHSRKSVFERTRTHQPGRQKQGEQK
jgi:hypothetical protein